MTRRLAYHIVDVFTDQRFGGNPLAVVHDAAGLTSAQMQQIAREFNFSESTFVMPTDKGSDCTHQVRIFTPTQEVPFAGHPNIGTAWVLAQRGDFADLTRGATARFGELAGVVAVTMQSTLDGRINVELRAPQTLSVGKPWPVGEIAAVLGLPKESICTKTHQPIEASVGLPFLFVALRDLESLAQVTVDVAALAACRERGMNPDVYCYVRDQQSIRARMFAPFDGVVEDPATGSAGCAIVALLHQSIVDAPAGAMTWHIMQGEQMGRPSVLAARTVFDGDVVSDVYLGGTCVEFAEGVLSV